MNLSLRKSFQSSWKMCAIWVVAWTMFSSSVAAQDVFLTNRANPSILYELDLSTNRASELLRFDENETVHAIAACSGENRIFGIDRNTQEVFVVELDEIPIRKRRVGRIEVGFLVVQMACSPRGRIFFSNNQNEELYILNPKLCSRDTGLCEVERLGVVESSPGAGDVDIEGADIEFNPQGELFLLTNGPQGENDRALYRVSLEGDSCDDNSCAAQRVGDVGTGMDNVGMAILPGGQLIIASNDDNLYEVDDSNAAVTSLGRLSVNGQFLNIRNGDLTALVPCPPTLDFEFAGNGAAVEPGDIISDQWGPAGITISTESPQSSPAMIFDSAAAGAGNEDIMTPNEDFGGPGLGSGGEATRSGRNALPRGHVLVISEDGNSSNPTPAATGGYIDFELDPIVARLTEVHVINARRSDGTVIAYDGNGDVIVERPILATGANSFQIVPIGAFNVARIRVVYKEPLAISGIVFCGACGVNY